MNLVSAIITTHNRCDLLIRAIESVLSQTYTELECIVVDDASLDETPKVCRRYPVIYIQIPKEESRGGNYARNLGIKASKGEYCAFLDDDDYWCPDKIEKQISLINQKNCELVYCGRINEIITDKGVSYVNMLPDPNKWGDMSKKILFAICCNTSTMLISRRALMEVGMFDEKLKFWQEYELSIRLAQRKSFYFVKEPLTIYRIDTQDPNRLTNKYYEWKNAVTYVNKKHNSLYSQLDKRDRIRVHKLKCIEGFRRCSTTHLKWKALLYYVKIQFDRLVLAFLDNKNE